MNPAEISVAIVSSSVIVEGIIDYYRDFNWIKVVSAILGIAVAFAFSFDIFSLLGVKAVYPEISVALTGLLIGRGGNYVNDLLQRVGVKK